MDLTLASIFMAIGAGAMSVASPCVFPVIPIIVTGTKDDHKFRPILITIGISLTFILMGVISTLFGHIIAGKMKYVELIAGIIISIFGILMLLDINIFKKITIFNRINSNFTGTFSGFFIGLVLGLVWIPCIGPLLSGILTTVATKGKLLEGVILLTIYSIGFSIPMLIVGYSTQAVRQKIKQVNRHALAIRITSGIILLVFGLYISFIGVV